MGNVSEKEEKIKVNEIGVKVKSKRDFRWVANFRVILYCFSQ